MKKLRLFDSLKFVRAIFVAVATAFILNIAHADTTAIQSVIAYGKTEQNGTPTPTNPVPIMTNNGVLKYKSGKNLFDINDLNIGSVASDNVRYKSYAVPNGTYTMSTPDFPTVSSTANIFFFAGDVSSGASSASNGVLQGTSRTINVTNGYYTIGYRSGMTNPNNPKNYSWQIEQGSTATAYVPYSGPTGIYVDGLTETIRDSAGLTATAQMLLGIDDTYRDEQNITTGAITRRVGVKVLDGTETWGSSSTYGATVYLQSAASNEFSPAAAKEKIISNYFVGQGVASTVTTHPENTCFFNSTGHLYFRTSKTPAEFKAWLAEQYAAGTPVIIVYPLATEKPESVAPKSLTTAPVRQTLGAIMNMPIKTILTDNTEIMSGANELIKIATTKYNEESFEDVQDALTGVFNAVEDVVTQTMDQAQAIDQIANNKQTRPNESCPPFKKCLLVEDEQGVPHWYEIYDPINDFLRPILAAAGLSGNQGAPTQTTHTENGSTIYDTSNIFYKGSGAFRKKYIDNNQQTVDRPFGPTTLPRCADDATRTTLAGDAGLCYNTGGMFRTLTEGADDDAGEWALVWNGNEGGASLGITPGVVYGIAKCTTVGQHTTQMTGDFAVGSNYWWPEKLNSYTASNPTTLASLIEQYPNSNVETVFNTLPNPYGTDDNPEYPRANYRNCWCKMTAIGVPGSGENDEQRYANGTIMSVSGGWVFSVASTSASTCAGYCAYGCASNIRARAAFRRNVLTVR